MNERVSPLRLSLTHLCANGTTGDQQAEAPIPAIAKKRLASISDVEEAIRNVPMASIAEKTVMSIRVLILSAIKPRTGEKMV